MNKIHKSIDVQVEEAINLLQEAVEYGNYSTYNMILQMEGFFRDSLEGALYAFHQENDHFTTAILRGEPVELSEECFDEFVNDKIEGDEHLQLELDFNIGE